jgi:ABC-type branched-subunit amino acid transport system substrate-binding protein
MRSFRSSRSSIALGLLSALCLSACNAITGLDQFEAASAADAGGMAQGEQPPDTRCQSHRECTERASAAAPGEEVVPAICVPSEGRCAELLSEDCTVVTGDYLQSEAIVLGSLFSTQGSQAATNVPRQQSAILAIEQINRVGGVPAGPTSAKTRPLVLVSCDESVNLLRAGEHLVHDLKVPAIIGPNTSQDTLDLSDQLTIAAGTLVISPTAVASSIAHLRDDGLTWLMVPSDEQRAPVMMQQINALETQLKQERDRDVLKLGVVFRDDALGLGTRVSLNALVFNGKALSDPLNLGNNVRIDPYDYVDADQGPLVDAYAEFQPDIMVLAGTAEAITQIMVPLEQRWSDEDAEHRPYYVLIDSSKVPELLAAAGESDDLRRRVRGTGITPGTRSAAVYNAFKVDYQLRFPDSPATLSGMGTSYDSAYAMAYALGATKDVPVSGAAIAQGLRRLSGGPTAIDIGSTKILAAFSLLAAGESITATGTFGPFQWTDDGASGGGTIEVWCIGTPTRTPAYASSGLTFDVATQQFSGEYTGCEP